MDTTLFRQKKIFPRYVMEKLSNLRVDYKEKNALIDQSRREGSKHLKAAVVLLLNFKKTNGQSEYIFQLIKRSQKISQGGDISCPGGMLQPRQDFLLSSILKKGVLPFIGGRLIGKIQKEDSGTSALIRLFLTTALREAWEEIGLNPLNTKFLGALPSYSLTMFARTIFPVVCMTRWPFPYRLSSEVEKILEIPVSYFFNTEHYAMLDVKTSLGSEMHPIQYQTPCLVVPNADGEEDILWGATFNIIHHFLRIISDDTLPEINAARTKNKILTLSYLSPKG
jgi:8-oxo-dGTP pyrophosphatase MutT (NUDIX family)